MNTAGPHRQLHATALQICNDLKPTVNAEIKSAQSVVRDYSRERRENTARLRLVLAEMEQRFSEGEVIAGAASMKQWCEVHKNAGALSYQRCWQILKGKSGNESKEAAKIKSQNLLDQFVSRICDTKKTLAEIQRQISASFPLKVGDQLKPLEKQINVAVYEAFDEFLALISPDGCEVSQGDNGKFWVREKRNDEDETEPDEAEDSHIEIKGGLHAGNLFCGDSKSRVKVSPKKATCEECIRRHAEWESNKPTRPEESEEQKAKRSAAAKNAAQTKAAKKATKKRATPQEMEQRLRNAETWVKDKLAQPMGECEMCGEAPATERIVERFNVEEYCAKCAADAREYKRKNLMRYMGVANVMGKFYTLERLVKLGGKPMGDGEVFTYPTVGDYLARLKKEFLGNPRYDQTVVVEYVARLEKKTEATQ